MSRSESERFWRENVGEGSEADWHRVGPLLDSYVELILQHATLRKLVSQAERNAAALWGHVYDSLHILEVIGPGSAGPIMDVGSGSGLPGVPVALSLPGNDFILLDRSSGKVEFLELVVATLGLRNVRVLCGEFGPRVLQEEAPAVLLSRAVKGEDLFKRMRVEVGQFPTSIIFATDKNESDWIRLAADAQLSLAKRVTYSLSDGAPGRVLLKFGPA